MKRINLQKDKFFYAVITATIIIGFLARLIFAEFRSSDYSFYLSGWIDTLKEAPGLRRFGVDVGNYTCPYLYVLAIISFIPVDQLYLIKLVSVAFDVFAAYLSYLIVYELTKDQKKSLIAFAAVFLCPTVFLNSAAWAQCDSIYSSFILCSLLFLIKNKPAKAMIFFGIAFALKLQSIFFAPVLVYLWFIKKVKIKHFFIIPITYAVSCIPAILCGRNIISTFTVYLQQGSYYNSLSMNAPTIWGLTADLNYTNGFFTYIGIGLAGLSVLALLISVVKTNDLKSIKLFDTAYLLMLLIPFFLPRMHERYFYCTDLFGIIYACLNYKKWPVCLLTITASLYTYLRYLKHETFERFPLTVGSVFMAAAIAIVIIDYIKKYGKNRYISTD